MDTIDKKLGPGEVEQLLRSGGRIYYEACGEIRGESWYDDVKGKFAFTFFGECAEPVPYGWPGDDCLQWETEPAEEYFDDFISLAVAVAFVGNSYKLQP